MEKSCVDEEMLADFIEGRLSGNERLNVERHLSDCDRCLMDFEVTRSLIQESDLYKEDTVPKQVTQAALKFVKSLDLIPTTCSREKMKRFLNNVHSKISETFQHGFWAQWRLAPVRSSKRVVSEDLVQVKKTFKEIDTEIDIEKIRGDKANIKVRLPKHNRKNMGARVSLIRGEREILSHLFDDQSDVLFEDIPFGKYSLVFTRDGIKIGIYRFEIKEPSNE